MPQCRANVFRDAAISRKGWLRCPTHLALELSGTQANVPNVVIRTWRAEAHATRTASPFSASRKSVVTRCKCICFDPTTRLGAVALIGGCACIRGGPHESICVEVKCMTSVSTQRLYLYSDTRVVCFAIDFASSVRGAPR